MRVALRRAAHQLLDEPKVLDDPLAIRIIGDAVGEIRAGTARHQSRVGRHFRAFLVARSRYAEDQLAASVARGVDQYVVLGAGLDTSAFRGMAAGVRLFEVDHPNTQAWKIKALEAASIAIPPALSFVPVNFERQELATELRVAGFQLNRAAFFSWLGVVPYLTKEAAAQTFGFIGSLPSGSGVVFDYAISPSALGLKERLALAALSARVAMAGEPFRLYFAPEELEKFLRGLGFRRIDQLGSQEINAKYFAGRGDGLKVAGSAGRIVGAWV